MSSSCSGAPPPRVWRASRVQAAQRQLHETLSEDAYVLVLRKPPSNMACPALGEAVARRGYAAGAARPSPVRCSCRSA
jgi:hypothetical protein